MKTFFTIFLISSIANVFAEELKLTEYAAFDWKDNSVINVTIRKENTSKNVKQVCEQELIALKILLDQQSVVYHSLSDKCGGVGLGDAQGSLRVIGVR